MRRETKTIPLVAGTFLAAMLALGAFARPSAAIVTLGFDPMDGVIALTDPPETLTVAFTVDTGVDTLKGFSVVLEFDPAVVAPVGVTPGPFLGSGPCSPYIVWLDSTAVGDSVAVDGAALGCDGGVGAGTLFEMRFIAASADTGTSPLACRDVRVRNQYNAVLNNDCTPGTITVMQPPISVDAATWGRMKALYR
jgi:hypothetical protein